ncbi:ABC-2 type transporter-domain-containing protein, partial [Blyttiomyces helicus]
KDKEILYGISGVVKPGEMLLVLGRPGSGCSSLLRTLANQTENFKEVRGEIMFAGLTPAEIRKYYCGEVLYCQEEDPHFPSLTVKETLAFALACRFKGNYAFGGQSSASFGKLFVDVVLRSYGLTRCRSTVVGDESLRGVSGGEKKRVSLAEATCVNAVAGLFDGCTKGLDAASALDFMRGLRNYADLTNRTTVASCYQASDAMFDLFDKVILLSEGHCVYNGMLSNSRAVAYFESLGFTKHPRDTKAEFLTTCASSGQIMPADLARKFRNSAIGHAVRAEVDSQLSPDALRAENDAFRKAIAHRKEMTGHARMVNSSFSVTVFEQALLLARREARITAWMPFAVVFKFLFSMIMALINGSVYIKLPTDTSGAFTRGGVLFFSLLFNSVSAMAELPKTMGGRPIIYKQRSFALYRPSAYYLAQSLFAFPINLVQITCFSCILYFMTGLQVKPDKFFIFVLTLVMSSEAFGGILKAIANSSAVLTEATSKAGAILMFFVIYSGYIVPEPDMHPWFKWVFYINP